MTTLFSTATRRPDDAAGTAPHSGLPTLVRQTLNLMAEHREEAQTRARLRYELNQYSDRALANLGMARSDIEDVVHGRFRA